MIRKHLLPIAIGIMVLGATPVARGDDAGSERDAGAVDGGRDANADAQSDTDAAVDPVVAELERKTRAIRSLVDGRAAPDLAVASLFEISLNDEATVRVEVERLRALLRDIDDAARRAEKVATRSRTDGGLDAAAGSHVDPSLWRARIDLDRARLAFYELPFERRTEILATRAAPSDAGAPLTDVQQREVEAEEQRRSALLAAQTARTEAERLVSTELARLLDVEHAQTMLVQDFARQRKQIAEQRDVTLGWQQRALEARTQAGASADRTYEELRGALRTARDALSVALDQLAGAPSAVPGPGHDALADLRVDVDTTAARKERDRVDVEDRRLQADEIEIRHERAAQLFDEIDKLNGERLALLDYLSSSKRGAVTGFTTAGWDQASSEVRQLTLILRYHRSVIGEWLLALRHPTHAVERALAGGWLSALEWLVALGAFVWLRRRSTAVLRLLHIRAEEAGRRARRPSVTPTARALAFLGQIHRPLEWLALLFVLRWFLAPSTQQILEVRVVIILITWIFGGALVVDVINALAAIGADSARGAPSDGAVLRLRSLRLMGRVVVVFGLILAISSMLVGRGTIYQWVFSTCWLASIPVLLVLVRWWREAVFERTARVRKPSAVQRWVLAQSKGWSTSFVAAAVGGVVLLGSGVSRGTRNWIGRFVITRRAMAYLFRRQLGKVEHTAAIGPIADSAFATLGPEHASAKWIPNDADEALDRLVARIRDGRGGVVAIVGERGIGKTAALHRLRGDRNDVVLVDAGAGVDAAVALAESPGLHALLVDDAQRFVQPVMGGLAVFDALLASATRTAAKTTWVLALDQVVWNFLERARGARPLFDDVIRLDGWREEQIVALLQTRTEEAGLTPSFEGLLERLPPTADEIDKQEALAQRGADFYRLLWDAATGNPGIALHMWRRSLGIDSDGRTAVRPSQLLDTNDLEALPDSSAFVLRAVLQLAPAHAEQIAKGTMLRLADVADALRYAASRGYVEERDGGYRVTWTWLRAVMLFLQRKHLLLTR